MNVRSFINKLSDYQGNKVFNPYTDLCEKYDLHNADKIRKNNLETVLNSFKGGCVDSIWIGRDLGHRGGRRTGIALTDEGQLSSANITWKVSLNQATKGKIIEERTAKSVWNLLKNIEENIFMWNVFPFHPYELGKPFSNRKHTSEERDVGLEILLDLMKLIKPKKLIAIGNDAYNCSIRIFDEEKVFKVRHPSYGGEKIFSKQISDLYDLVPHQDLFNHISTSK